MSPDKAEVLSILRRWSIRGIRLGLVMFIVIAAVILFRESSLTALEWAGVFAACVFCGWLEQMMFGWSLDPSNTKNHP